MLLEWQISSTLPPIRNANSRSLSEPTPSLRPPEIGCLSVNGARPKIYFTKNGSRAVFAALLLGSGIYSVIQRNPGRSVLTVSFSAFTPFIPSAIQTHRAPQNRRSELKLLLSKKIFRVF
jgi:hypothetical protein